MLLRTPRVPRLSKPDVPRVRDLDLPHRVDIEYQSRDLGRRVLKMIVGNFDPNSDLARHDQISEAFGGDLGLEVRRKPAAIREHRHSPITHLAANGLHIAVIEAGFPVHMLSDTITTLDQ